MILHLPPEIIWLYELTASDVARYAINAVRIEAKESSVVAYATDGVHLARIAWTYHKEDTFREGAISIHRDACASAPKPKGRHKSTIGGYSLKLEDGRWDLICEYINHGHTQIIKNVYEDGNFPKVETMFKTVTAMEIPGKTEPVAALGRLNHLLRTLKRFVHSERNIIVEPGRRDGKKYRPFYIRALPHAKRDPYLSVDALLMPVEERI